MILASNGNLAWVQAFRKIVTRRLKVELFLTVGSGDDSLYKRLYYETYPKMEALLHPVAPAATEVTDEDAYLVSRAS
jgi:hypothetical protein